MKTLTLFFLLIVGIVTANGATLTVNSNLDNETNGCSVGVCTLREAISAANNSAGADTISFSVTGTIDLTSILPTISDSVSITGPGARVLTVQRSTAGGTTDFRIFTIGGSSGAVVNISGITIANGKAALNSYAAGIFLEDVGNTLNLMDVTVRDNFHPGPFGGGVYCKEAMLNITRSTFTGNQSGEGMATGNGGAVNVNNGCTANINNSTFSGNISNTVGGAIINFSSLTLNNVTVTENTAINSGGGGIMTTSSGTTIVRNSIIANNTAPFNPDVSFHPVAPNVPPTPPVYTSQGNNLIGISVGGVGFTDGVNGDKVGTSAAPLDPMLGPLANNGGQTDTHSLENGSPAIDAGNNCVVTATCPTNNPSEPLTTDQRGTGFDRLRGAAVDIGAFEAQIVDTDNDGIPDSCDIDSNPGATDFDKDGIVDSSGCDTQIGPPTNKDQCTNGGWMRFNTPAFKNQGDCIKYVRKGN
ncbi:MAG: hypothetical protein LC768_15060 [Acidobacteria bacterium]|nr:hypothetical protein [Acidobacteriota bacterium]MCA1639626.1 hypothetical protein [Acidobacteriota bacterium]